MSRTDIPEKFIKTELHCHTVWSSDSSNKIPDLLREARRRGIQRLAITDHNTIGGALLAKQIDPELVIVGQEILTSAGELLAFYIKEEIPKRLSPLETIARLKAQEAFIAVPHVFDIRRHGWHMQALQEILPHVDALEVFNARCFSGKVNERARQFAEEMQLAGIAGSDAHSLVELGLAATYLPDFNNAQELRLAVSQARIEGQLLSVGQHLHASLAIGLGRLRLRKRD